MKNFFLLYSHLYARISSEFVNKKVNSRQSYKQTLYLFETLNIYKFEYNINNG